MSGNKSSKNDKTPFLFVDCNISSIMQDLTELQKLLMEDTIDPLFIPNNKPVEVESPISPDEKRKQEIRDKNHKNYLNTFRNNRNAVQDRNRDLPTVIQKENVTHTTRFNGEGEGFQRHYVNFVNQYENIPNKPLAKECNHCKRLNALEDQINRLIAQKCDDDQDCNPKVSRKAQTSTNGKTVKIILLEPVDNQINMRIIVNDKVD